MNIPGLEVINPSLSFRGSLRSNNPDHIIIHHALAKNCTIWDVHRWHLNNGWAGCGYHFFVNKKGTVFIGREVAWSGAHCPPLNSRSIGICLEGCYQEYKNQTDREVPLAQLNALVRLVSYLLDQHNIAVNNLRRHADFSTKLCPGNYFPWGILVNGVRKEAVAPVISDKTFRFEVAVNILLRQGSIGEEVRLLQGYLNDLGYNSGRLDGIFGPVTDGAVRDFQRDNGLSVDGIAGPKTLSRMKEIMERGPERADLRPQDVFRIRVDGKQVIALTGYANARSYAEKTYPGKKVNLENTRTGEVYSL